MLIRDSIQVRLPDRASQVREAAIAKLPKALKLDPLLARTGMLQRLAASRLFALGDRAGVLRSARKRSNRPFRLDVRQRVVVKALVSRHMGKGKLRGAALAAHVVYLGRPGAGAHAAKAEFFDRSADAVDARLATCEWADDRHHFRVIISPEHGDRIADLPRYTREVMRRVADDLGQPSLEWIATCHFDTDQPHAHVLIRGRGAGGKDLVIPREYIGYGLRARAQEVAHELLGDLSRADAERRIWRETQADRFTGFDRRLLLAADRDGCVDDGVGASEVWAALTRGRLRHLEGIGLATRMGRRYRLAPDMELRLRALQLRKDIIRTLHQRRLEAGREILELEADRLRGRVVGRGSHDELGAARYLIVRDRDGVEHYARLRFGEAQPKLGRSVDLARTPRGTYAVVQARALPDRDLS